MIPYDIMLRSGEYGYVGKRGAETRVYREFHFFQELGKVLASNSGRKNSAYHDELSRWNYYYYQQADRACGSSSQGQTDSAF